MTPLLDVNMLVALAWPTHVHHAEAVNWFSDHLPASWATASVTQAGFVRVSSNRKVLGDARSPAEAAAVLRALTELDGHELWTDDLDLVRVPGMAFDSLSGYRQVTDAHLLALARRHGGRLVTFDRAIADLADTPDRVTLLTL